MIGGMNRGVKDTGHSAAAEANSASSTKPLNPHNMNAGLCGLRCASARILQSLENPASELSTKKPNPPLH